MENSLTLLQLTQRIAKLMTIPATQNIWVTAELSDVSVRNGHCYMELLEKDEQGRQVAKVRGVIWASNYMRIAPEFMAATGQQFSSGLKVMVCASASMHPVYGMSLVITAVNPEYTMGDLIRRRQEILRRLKAEGILELNRQLEWTEFPHRIAVISAQLAAGYGDFINQLYNNGSRLRFSVKLFPSIMQGNSAPESIIASLEAIANESDQWDCVVIIRGGGATSDLQAFEDYELAATIAQFPIPVMIGIGHERDITVLDYVANRRVKTPTAAAEFLIAIGDNLLANLQQLGSTILQKATDLLSASKEQLSYYEGLMPIAPTNALHRAQTRLNQSVMALNGISGRRIAPAHERLRIISDNLSGYTTQAIARSRQKVDTAERMLGMLSPVAVLRRGYSLTRVGGRAVTSATELREGEVIETLLANGTVVSTINTISSDKKI